MSRTPEELSRAIHNSWSAAMRNLGYRRGPGGGASRTHTMLVTFEELDEETRTRHSALASRMLPVAESTHGTQDALIGQLEDMVRDSKLLVPDDHPGVSHAIVLGFLHEYERSEGRQEPGVIIRNSLQRSADLVVAMTHSDNLHAQILQAAYSITECVASGGKVLAIGNGGSMADAMHFTTELSGQFRKSRAGLSAVSASDPTFLSCVANDHGYVQVFSRFIESIGNYGDVLIAISTSGSSENVLQGASTAKTKGIPIISMTGAETSPLGKLADVHVVTPGDGFNDSVQEQQKIVLHTICEVVEGLLSLN